jgi:hypothetical protein
MQLLSVQHIQSPESASVTHQISYAPPARCVPSSSIMLKSALQLIPASQVNCQPLQQQLPAAIANTFP